MTDYSNGILDDLVAYTQQDGRWHQEVVLELTPSGCVSVFTRDFLSGDSGYDPAEYLGRVRVYRIAGSDEGLPPHGCAVDVDALAKDLGEGGKLSVLIDRILAGFSVRWNGNDNVGDLSDDAEEAEDELMRLLDGRDYVSDVAVWDVSEWLESSGQNARAILASYHLSPDSSADDIAAAAKQIRAEFDGDVEGILTGNVVYYLETLIDEVRGEG